VLSVVAYARQRERSHTEGLRAADAPAPALDAPAHRRAAQPPPQRRPELALYPEQPPYSEAAIHPTLTLHPAEPARRLEERGLAVTASALRVAYAAGGDGGTDLRLDLRNAAAFVRDPDALVTCLLLPLSASARMEAQARRPARLGAGAGRASGARAAPRRARRRARPAAPRPRRGAAGAPGGGGAGAGSAPAFMPGCCLCHAAGSLARF